MFCEHIEQSSQLFRLFQMSLGNEIKDLVKRERKKQLMKLMNVFKKNNEQIEQLAIN